MNEVISLADKLPQRTDITMPEEWLRSRVRGWMESTESPYHDWWIGCYNADGKWIHGSSDKNTYAPPASKQDYAMRVCKHVNSQLAMGGAWLVGWTLGTRRFYLMWKDPDGDIQIPIDCDKPWSTIREWELDAWSRKCFAALEAWAEIHDQTEFRKGQRKKVAQGEKVSPEHFRGAPEVKL